jgi:hypothetical protein
MGFGMISNVREKQHEREIMPEKPPRAVMRAVDLFAKRGSNQKEMSSPWGGISGSQKNRRIQRTLRLLLVSSICAQSKTTT